MPARGRLAAPFAPIVGGFAVGSRGMDGSRKAVVWLGPEQVGLARAVARAAELEIVGAGSAAKGMSGHVAAELGTKQVDDLRAALATAACDLVWIAAPGAFGAGSGHEDASAVARAHGRGVKIASLEPIPGAALDLVSGAWTAEPPAISPASLVRLCPLGRHWGALRDAAEVVAAFGEAATVCAESWCTPVEGTLGARLYGCLELVHGVMGEPETIEAAFVSAGVGRGVHGLPGETLRDLHGDIAATMRFADGRAANLVASNRAGRWNRTLTMIGTEGRLRVYDDGHEWIGAGGERRDQSRQRSRGDAPAAHAVDAMAESLTRMLEPGVPEAPPTEHAAVLAIAQAAILSCRTGQAESPATIRRMVGAA